MKTINVCTALVLWILATNLSFAQDRNSEMRKEIEASLLEAEKVKATKQKEKVIDAEKDLLKVTVEAINERVNKNEITLEEGNKLKEEAAQKSALNIEDRIRIIDSRISLLERNDGGATLNEGPKMFFGLGHEDADDDVIFGIKVKNMGHDENRIYDRRTSSQLVFSFGLNNAIIEGQSLEDSPYKLGGSRYAELGMAWSTRVFKESNWLRFRYGVSFQFNGLKPTDNRYFVDTGAETELQDFGLDLDKSKFRMDNVVVPIHFEIGPSRKIEKEDYFRYNTNKSFKVGLGGYAGLNMSTRQKLKFEDDGEKVKQKLKAGYNTNNLIYGLSGYIGYGDISLYAKYDLNTIFKDNPIEQRNVSLGLRWDWD